jgi:hypothetical protein
VATSTLPLLETCINLFSVFVPDRPDLLEVFLRMLDNNPCLGKTYLAKNWIVNLP